MASVKVCLILFFVLHTIFLFSSPVHCADDEEDQVLQGINSYRQAKRLPALVKHKKGSCLADEIADKLEDEPCSSPQATTPVLISNYPDQLSKCGIDINRTRDGVVLPTCVPKLVPTLLLTNYTHTRYARYMNDSKFTGAGLGTQDDWMVVVLTTDSPGGDFAGARSLVSMLEVEEKILKGINEYRKFFKLSALAKNKRAGCIADAFSSSLENNEVCNTTRKELDDIDYSRNVSSMPMMPLCGLDEYTMENSAALLLVCVPYLAPLHVLRNLTRAKGNAAYLKDSRFVSVGVGIEDDWIAVVLADNSTRWLSAGGYAMVSRVGFGHFLACLVVLGMLVYLV